MQVVILAGGMGSRMRSVSGNLPKSLLPVNGRPFIEHQFDLLKSCGLKRVLLCVGKGGDRIEAHVGDGSAFGMQADYSRENPGSLMGTGGAILNAWPKLDDVFMALYGDSYLPFDFGALARAWKKTRPPVLMSVYRNADKWDPSNTMIEDGRIVRYDKNMPPGVAPYIDYGVSVYQKNVFKQYSEGPFPLDLAGILKDAVAKRMAASYSVAERFYEIGKPEGLSELEALMKENVPARKTPAVFVDRDGTLNEMIFDETHGRFDAPLRADQLVIKPGARDFMAALRASGVKPIVVTNQPGIARGYLDVLELERINERLARGLAADGEAWDALYYCPHSPDKTPGHVSEFSGLCDCRKPAPGMLFRAAQEHHVDLSASWMVGDGLNDVKAGRRAGCRTILIGNVKMEHMEKFADDDSQEPDFIAGDLSAALKIISENAIACKR